MQKLKIISLSILSSILLISTSNASFWTTYSDEIKIEEQAEEKNTLSNIKKAKLIKNSITSYRKKLESYKLKLSIENDSLINGVINQLKLMESALDKISNTNISKQVADDVMASILKNLKEFTSKANEYLKPLVENYLQELKTYKEKYAKTWGKLADIVDKIESKFNLYFEKTPKMSSLKKNAIIARVEAMKEHADKLREITKINFEEKEKVKEFYNEYKQNIINEYKAIIKILK